MLPPIINIVSQMNVDRFNKFTFMRKTWPQSRLKAFFSNNKILTFRLSIIAVVVWNLIWEQNHSKVKYRIKYLCSIKVDSKLPHAARWSFDSSSAYFLFACSILHLHIVHIYEIKTKEVKTLTISGGLKFVLWCFHASSNFYTNGCNLVNFVLSFAHIRTKGATIWSKLHTWCNWNPVCLSYDGIMFSLHYSKALP